MVESWFGRFKVKDRKISFVWQNIKLKFAEFDII